MIWFSQSSVLHSQPKSTVGTPAYIAPEVLLKKEYDGKVTFMRKYYKSITLWRFDFDSLESLSFQLLGDS